MAKGFKAEIGKQKAENKAKKQDAKHKERERKITLWLHQKMEKLEAYDIRTPSIYFTDRENTENHRQHQSQIR